MESDTVALVVLAVVLSLASLTSKSPFPFCTAWLCALFALAIRRSVHGVRMLRYIS